MKRNMTRRHFLVVSGLTATGTLLAACAPPAAPAPAAGEEEPAMESINLIWDTFRGTGTGWNEERIETFGEMYPNVSIEFRPLTGSSQQDNYGKMYALFAADDLGDICAFDPSHYHFWRAINKNIIGPLDEYVAAEALDLGQWFDTFMRLQYYNGELYGLPSWGWAGFDTLVTNAVHFESAGVDLPDPVGHETSMDTIAEWAHHFRDEEQGRFGLAISHSEANMVVLCRAFGGHLINEEGTQCMLMDSAESQEALRWAYQLTVEDQVLPTPDDIGGNFGAALLADKLTMNWCGSLCVRNFDRDIEDPDVARASQILFPTREDGRYPSQIRGAPGMSWPIHRIRVNPSGS